MSSSPSSPSAPSSPSSPSVLGSSSTGITVGAAIVAIVKSLSDIWETTSSSNFISLICITEPISKSVKLASSFSGIFLILQIKSTFLLTTFKTPPLFKPGDFSSLIKIIGTDIFIFDSSFILKKSICIGLSFKGSVWTSLGKTLIFFLFNFKLKTVEKKPVFDNSLIIFG